MNQSNGASHVKEQNAFGREEPKIYGDIRPVSDKKNLYGVTFLYYLNPTPNDRNLEWDRKNNLCDKPGNLEMIVNHMPTLLP